MRARPPRIGVLYDYPQGDGLFVDTLRLGLDAGGARDVDLVEREVLGLPAGTREAIVEGFEALVADRVAAIVGPSISDNALVAAPLADAHEMPSINYSGSEQTRSEYMFHYQVGSLEEEPPVLAQRMADRGLTRAAVLYDDSEVGHGYQRAFELARHRFGITIAASAFVAPLIEDAETILDDLRAVAPDALVYFGLGVASRAVAVARAALAWDIPVLANSALMFGYARPDWRDGYAGWEYIDTIADDNTVRAELRATSKRAAGGPIGCAAYDIGRIVGAAIASCHDNDAGPTVAAALRRVKRLPAASGYDGTLMGFGQWDHAALKGHFLVLREWRAGRSVQV
ncbi:MAG: ABC transporter substrate-binding protein [Actinomycetota bacterium]